VVLVHLRDAIALAVIGHNHKKFFGVTRLTDDLVMAEGDRTALAFWACGGDIIVQHFQTLQC